MGNFYTNITVRTTDLDPLLHALEGRRALVTPPIGPDFVVYDEQSDAQDLRQLEALTSKLSRTLAVLAWAVLNHDDDVLRLLVYHGGAKLYAYNPAHGLGSWFRSRQPKSDATDRLCRAFARPDAEADVATILERAHGPAGYVFEVDRHTALAAALGWPDASVGFGFRYITQGELPAGLLREHLRSTG